MSNIEPKTVPLDSLIPYWRNPRKNDVSVEKVAASIEKYGYQSPIVVDQEMTIITGHTRYLALKKLGYTEALVLISDLPPKQAKEYRIIDNKTSEYATWTDDLLLELKEFTDKNTLDIFFPNIKLETNFGDFAAPITADHVAKAGNVLDTAIGNISQAKQDEAKIVIPCPYCEETITLLKRDVDNVKNWE